MTTLADRFEEVAYHCHLCGTDRTVAVRFRNAGEDVIAWLDGVVRPAVGADHFGFRPTCPSEHCDLKLPAPAGAAGIGCRVVH